MLSDAANQGAPSKDVGTVKEFDPSQQGLFLLKCISTQRVDVWISQIRVCSAGP